MEKKALQKKQRVKNFDLKKYEHAQRQKAEEAMASFRTDQPGAPRFARMARAWSQNGQS